MHPPWTSEQIEGLAYDKYGVRASRTLSTPEKWLSFGRSDGLLWGIFPNRNKPPLQTTVSIHGPRFSCTCANFKFPCNHGLALLLMYHDRPAAFEGTDKPDWLNSNSPSSSLTNIDTNTPRRSSYSQRRMTTLMAGLCELELWLHDLVGHGFATLQNQPRHYWTQMADRLVDAHAIEVASEVRQLATIPDSSDNWPEELLAKIGRLHLLIQGFHNFDTLSTETQADLLTAASGPLNIGQMMADQATGDQTIRDRWQIVGRRFERVRKKMVQHVWLWGENSNRPALIIDVTHGKQQPDSHYMIGTAIDAVMQFHLSATPFRANLMKVYSQIEPNGQISGFTSIAEGLSNHADAMAVNPWLSRFPLALCDISADFLSEERKDVKGKKNSGSRFGNEKFPVSKHRLNTDQKWFLQDSQGYVLPLPEKFEHGWHFRAIAGEGSLHLFGEWDGRLFHPLTIWKDGRWLPVNILKGIR